MCTGRTLSRALLIPCMIGHHAVARAHIQWFAHVSLRQAPKDPWHLWRAEPAFVWLALGALAVMALLACIDRRLSRLRAWPDLSAHPGLFTGLRLGVGLCFAAYALYFRDAPIILTPELHTQDSWVWPLQWGLAACALAGLGYPAALGLLALYGQGIARYGLFHLLDYTLFLGLAACLRVTHAPPRQRRHALLCLRVSVAFAFMWGAVEKWLYPDWTYPLLCGDGKALLMGLTPDFFMQGAGYIEFCTAFAVLYGAVAARVACVVLIALMCAAMPMFGPIDVVGHAPFIVALAVLACCDNPLAPGHAATSPAQPPWLAPARWAALLAAWLAGLPFAYQAAHWQLQALRDLSCLPCALTLPLLVLAWDATWRWPARRRPPPGAWMHTRVSAL